MFSIPVGWSRIFMFLNLYLKYLIFLYLLLIYTLFSVDRIYPTEHFKNKYAVDEVYYTSEVSVCVCLCMCFPPLMVLCLFFLCRLLMFFPSWNHKRSWHWYDGFFGKVGSGYKLPFWTDAFWCTKLKWKHVKLNSFISIRLYQSDRKGKKVTFPKRLNGLV